MTFMTHDIYDTADFPKAPRVRLGAIMTKLGFIKERFTYFFFGVTLKR